MSCVGRYLVGLRPEPSGFGVDKVGVGVAQIVRGRGATLISSNISKFVERNIRIKMDTLRYGIIRIRKNNPGERRKCNRIVKNLKVKFALRLHLCDIMSPSVF